MLLVESGATVIEKFAGLSYPVKVRFILLLAAWPLLHAATEPPLRCYVADLGAHAVTIAWGKASGTTRNTIGKGAESSGAAELQIDGKTLRTTASWLRVEGLRPDTVYSYSLKVGGAEVAAASVRTWPEKASSLTFFVLGDFGNGSRIQYAIAARMEAERVRREQAGQPVRFVVAGGDNIYGKLSSGGSADRDWERKFFAPYQKTLHAVPFKAVLGNHDGNESEATKDLAACLDNFFMPDRWYRFTFGDFAEFLALDSTKNQPEGRPAPVFLPDGEQSRWLETVLAERPLPWRIVIMHHPMFTAGPNHAPFLEAAPHWFAMMKRSGVQAVFAGHEHNLQVSERNEATGEIQFFVSGAGGELRASDVRKKMAPRHIALWSNQNHFLAVTVTDKEMVVEPIGIEPVQLRNPAGASVPGPVRFRSHR